MPGESFLPVLDALWEAGVGVINTRHEAAAANMAEAAGKLTGRAAVCLVTRGPGASHASIALHTAYQDGTPLVLVVGQVDRELLGRDAFQEMDYERVFGSSAKAVLTIDDADRIPELVAQAMHVAHSGRPGPVVLVVPEDVQYDRTTAPVAIAPPAAAPPLTDADRDALLGEAGPGAAAGADRRRPGLVPVGRRRHHRLRRAQRRSRSRPPSAGRTRSTTRPRATPATWASAAAGICAGTSPTTPT